MARKLSGADFDKRDNETFEEYYIRLAKVTDQRLVRIEKMSGLRGEEASPGFEHAYEWAYRKAVDVLPEGQIRFNAKIPKPGTWEFRERETAMQVFLRSPSSTKGGIQKTFINKANTFNKNYGTSFTGEQLATLFERGDWDKLYKKDKFGSDTIFKAIAKVQAAEKNAKKLEEIINQKGKSREKINAELKAAMKKAGITGSPADDVALEILRKSNLRLYKTMDTKTRAVIRRAIRNL